MPVITLMTDFGLKDGNVGVMKGVMLGICPAAQIVDISHLIPAQDVAQAALILSRSIPYFLEGTIHVAVVDPGVGTQRRPMAARLGDQYLVGPDNGLVTMALERAERMGVPVEFYHLNQPQYWLPQVSHVFHGRDIFAPAAAHLANGIPLSAVGEPFSDPLRIALPQPQRKRNGWQGEIIHIDHFGNAASNIRSEHLAETNVPPDRRVVKVAGYAIHGMVNTFGERAAGEIVALLGSTGNLIVSVVNGNAAERLDIHVGDVISVTFR